MAAIATSVETTPNPRVGVSLSAWAADGPVDVYRVHPDTSRWLVRGMSSVSGAVAFGWDYEAPHMVAFHYEALSSSTLIVSPDTTVPVDGAYLSAPGLPTLASPVELVGKPKVVRARPRTVLRPIGRADAVVIGDSRKSGEFGVRLRTRTSADADVLDDILAWPTLLLRIPGTRYPWQYVDVGDVDDDPSVSYRPVNPADPYDVGAWSEWDLPCVVTGMPVGGIVGDPTASYQAWRDNPPGTTYGDDRTNTYLQLLQGL